MFRGEVVAYFDTKQEKKQASVFEANLPGIFVCVLSSYLSEVNSHLYLAAGNIKRNIIGDMGNFSTSCTCRVFSPDFMPIADSQ